MRYAIFGGRVKNGARDMEGGFNDLLDVADSVDSLKQKFMLDDVRFGVISYNEITKKHEESGFEIVCKRFYLKNERDIVGNEIVTAYPIDWYQIVDLSGCVVIESVCDDGD